MKIDMIFIMHTNCAFFLQKVVVVPRAKKHITPNKQCCQLSNIRQNLPTKCYMLISERRHLVTFSDFSSRL